MKINLSILLVYVASIIWTSAIITENIVLLILSLIFFIGAVLDERKNINS